MMVFQRGYRFNTLFFSCLYGFFLSNSAYANLGAKTAVNPIYQDLNVEILVDEEEDQDDQARMKWEAALGKAIKSAVIRMTKTGNIPLSIEEIYYAFTDSNREKFAVEDIAEIIEINAFLESLSYDQAYQHAKQKGREKFFSKIARKMSSNLEASKKWGRSILVPGIEEVSDVFFMEAKYSFDRKVKISKIEELLKSPDGNSLEIGETSISLEYPSQSSKPNIAKAIINYIEKIEPETIARVRKRFIELLVDLVPSGESTFEGFHNAWNLSEIDSKILFGNEESEENSERGVLFENFSELKKRSVQEKPGRFRFVHDPDSFPDDYEDVFLKAIQEADEIMVTTANLSADLYLPQYEAMINRQKYLESQGLKAIILTYPQNMAFNIDHNPDLSTKILDIENGRFVIHRDIWLSHDLLLSNIHNPEKLVNPLSSVGKEFEKDVSIVVMSSQLLDEARPKSKNSDFGAGKRIYGTGSTTIPNSHNAKDISQRTDRLSNVRANYGFLRIVKEFRTNDFVGGFQALGHRIEPVPFDPKRKAFVVNKKVFSSKNRFAIEKGGIAALVSGDTHRDKAHPTALHELVVDIEYFHPTHVVLHDLLNNSSISDWDTLLQRILKSEAGKNSLFDEMHQAANFIQNLLRKFPWLTIVIPNANHPDWALRPVSDLNFARGNLKDNKLLTLLLEEMRENRNWFKAVLSGRLLHQANPTASHFVEGLDDLEDLENRLLVLEPGDSFDIEGYEISNHGNKGINGGRTVSANTLKRVGGRVLIGHNHKVFTNYGKKLGSVGHTKKESGSYSDRGGYNDHEKAYFLIFKGLRDSQNKIQPAPFAVKIFDNGKFTYTLEERRDFEARVNQGELVESGIHNMEQAKKAFYEEGFPNFGRATVIMNNQQGQVDQWQFPGKNM